MFNQESSQTNQMSDNMETQQLKDFQERLIRLSVGFVKSVEAYKLDKKQQETKLKDK